MKQEELRNRLFSLPPLWRLVKAIGWRSVSKSEMQQVLAELSQEFGEEAMEAAAQELLYCEVKRLNRWALVPSIQRLATFIIGPRPPICWRKSPSALVVEANEVERPNETTTVAAAEGAKERALKTAKPVCQARAHVLSAYCEHLKSHDIPFALVKEVKPVPDLPLRVVDLIVHTDPRSRLVAVRRKLTKLQRHDLLRWREVKRFEGFETMRIWAVRSEVGMAWTEEVVTEAESTPS